MNADELAIYLEDITDSEKSPYRQAATMLRQLQAENKELKIMRGNSVLVPSDKLKEMQAEIEALKKEKWLTEIDAKQQALKKIIDWLVLEHDTLACSSYPMSKEKR